jgi:riboflavin kinase / FMN adenylyltransferase
MCLGAPQRTFKGLGRYGISIAVMRVLRHLARQPQPLAATVLTLGNFDGVHLGHQAILRRAVERARAIGGRAVALTFEPHPLAVLVPERAPPIIQPLHDRLVALRDLGIDVTVLQRFTRRFAALDPEAFVRDFLLRHLEVRHVVVGYSVNFGRDRAGSAETLRALGAQLGFAVDVVGPVAAPGGAPGEQVSSTQLRALLQQGDMVGAQRLLGRPYALRGRVVVGDRRGRTLGFPTANLHVRAGLLLPPDGVYAVTVPLDGARHLGVLNIGVRPTFGGRRRTIEAHLLDFAGDLYRRWLVVEVRERLRGEASFDGPDALRAAIADDVARARRLLGAAAMARSGR